MCKHHLSFSITKPDYQRLSNACNLARNGPDITDSWDSMIGIVNVYGENKGDFAEVARPGYFNDPDEVLENSAFKCSSTIHPIWLNLILLLGVL